MPDEGNQARPAGPVYPEHRSRRIVRLESRTGVGSHSSINGCVSSIANPTIPRAPLNPGWRGIVDQIESLGALDRRATKVQPIGQPRVQRDALQELFAVDIPAGSSPARHDRAIEAVPEIIAGGIGLVEVRIARILTRECIVTTRQGNDQVRRPLDFVARDERNGRSGLRACLRRLRAATLLGATIIRILIRTGFTAVDWNTTPTRNCNSYGNLTPGDRDWSVASARPCPAFAVASTEGATMRKIAAWSNINVAIDCRRPRPNTRRRIERGCKPSGVPRRISEVKRVTVPVNCTPASTLRLFGGLGRATRTDVRDSNFFQCRPGSTRGPACFRLTRKSCCMAHIAFVVAGYRNIQPDRGKGRTLSFRAFAPTVVRVRGPDCRPKDERGCEKSHSARVHQHGVPSRGGCTRAYQMISSPQPAQEYSHKLFLAGSPALDADPDLRETGGGRS